MFKGSKGNQTHRYLHGPQVDQVLAEETAAGETRWALTDHQGSVRDVMDNNATVLNHITYDSFGQVTSETNRDIDFRFGYTGRELDDETGLMYYRARYFDPAVGTFVSEDPLGFDAGDVNVYRYVFNSPMNYIDPSGMTTTTADGYSYPSSNSNHGHQNNNYAEGAVLLLLLAAALKHSQSSIPTPIQGGVTDFSNAATASNAFPSITATDPREFDPNRGALTPSTPVNLPKNMAYPQPNEEGMNDAGPFGGGFCEDLADILEGTTEALLPSQNDLSLPFLQSGPVPAPNSLPAFPDATRAKPKTAVQGGGGLRRRWKDRKGNIYEWDSQHGTVEKYNRKGKHQGEYDYVTGQQLKKANKTRKVEP